MEKKDDENATGAMTRDENAMRDKLELGVLVLGIRKRERLGLLDGYGGDTV